MKILISHHPVRGARREARGGISPCPKLKASSPDSAFTLIEIAICLAIISFALLAIIGVLPIGMNVQRDVREETVINQDATVLLQAIRGAARGSDNLTNYVYAITNYWTLYSYDGVVKSQGANGYTFDKTPQVSSAGSSPSPYPVAPYSTEPITNGVNIIGLLSTPEFVLNAYDPPATIYPAVPNLFYVGQRYGNNFTCYSNHVVAYVHSISGLAAEKPPQNNDIMREDSLTYRLFVVNAPMPVATNVFDLPPNERQFMLAQAANQSELRLTFYWPQRPNGTLGPRRQTFRSTLAGQLTPTEYFAGNLVYQLLYFYQSQSFTNAP